MRNIQNLLIKGSRLNCSHYRNHQINACNQSKVRYETSRHFIIKNREYLKGKVSELETISKNRNISDLLYRDIMNLRSNTNLEVA